MTNSHHFRERESLPDDWLITSIGAISDVVSGGTPKANNPDNFAEPAKGIAWLTPADLSGYTAKYISHGARDLTQTGYESSSAKLIPAGSILFSSRAPIGYVVIAKNNISTNQGFKNFILPNGIDSSYAYYFLRSIRELAENLGTGTTFKEISGSTAKTLPFILPPLAEQKIIADKLDILLAQVENAKTSLIRTHNILKRFRQSVLVSAVSGRLTEGWKKETSSEWVERKLENIAANIVDCPHSTPEWSEKGKYCVRTTAFSPFYLDLSEQGFVSEAIYQDRIRRLKPIEGDILYSREGTVGVACQIPPGIELCLGQRMVLIRSGREVNSKYLTIVLNSEKILSIARSKTLGSTASRVNMKDIRNYPIPVPSLKEQVEIVRRVEELFIFADTIEKKTNIALDRANNLVQSILAKAFRGDLTTNWRIANPDLITGKNSAQALLKKIKSEREIIKEHPKTKSTITKTKVGSRMKKQIIPVVEALKQVAGPLTGQQLLTAAGYPIDSTTEELEKFFLDIRESLIREKSILKLERSDDGQDWFALADINKKS
ncbi:restriction endonuclease subunit S [Rahnella aceris]|uniref:restriction endonuclease subunit S n=1 Tax=Rahnella sp. (strain Y9602) TaxID=2703885 RepID=UPI001908B687|nr:restriction endonuclease subunit S [Rahnella aceris]QQN33506.1 restriction endonuclease subunit S [Rahnella aceris]